MPDSSSLDLLPWPRRVVTGEGGCPLAPLRLEWSGVHTPRLERGLASAAASFASLSDGAAQGECPCRIDCRSRSPELPALDDDESYRLCVTADGIRVSADSEWGVLRAAATLKQLPLDSTEGWFLPRIEIDDAPRFAWRGVMLDPARRFLSIDALMRTLEAMAFYKLNVLHLHLSDDQGFRFPSERFPLLPEQGGCGSYYRLGELRALIERAADLGIRVVPELDMPGHCTSWLAAYPQWGARKTRLPASQRFGVHEALLDPTRDELYDDLAELLGEVATVFPDRFLHIGGDEVNTTWWDESPPIRRYMEANGISGGRGLQAHFNRRVAGILAALERRMIGWDEVLDPGLGRETTVQSWRGAGLRDHAVAEGFDCVVSAGLYLDLFYPADLHYRVDPEASAETQAAQERSLLGDPRLAHLRGGLEWAQDFAARAAGPAAAGEPAAGARVLGGEACLWGELVSEPLLDLRLWSRMPAIAERLWSPAELVEAESMYARLRGSRPALTRAAGIDLGAQQAELFAGLGLSDDEYRAIRPLLDTLEPVKWYARLLGEEAMQARIQGRRDPPQRPYGTDTPLERVVDFLPPESLWARDFARCIDALLADPDRLDLRDRLAAIAMHWHEQRPLLYELDHRAPALMEIEPLAEALGELAEILAHCLAALPGRISRHEYSELQEELTRLGAPRAELVIAVIPALERLAAVAAGERR